MIRFQGSELVVSPTFIRYITVGVVNTAVGYGCILLLQYGVGLSPISSNAAGFLVGWVVSYLLNRRFTFRSDRPHFEALPRFVAAGSVCYAINAACLYFLLSLTNLPGWLAQAFAVATYTVSFYLVNKHVVFHR